MEARTVEHIHGIPVIESDPDGVINLSKMKHAGSGIEGDVYFTNDGNKVIKAVRLRYQGGIEHSPFVEFVGLCLENKNNPYFPKIHNAKIYKIKERNEKHVTSKAMGPVNAARRRQRGELSAASPYLLVVTMETLAPIARKDKDKIEPIFNSVGLSLEAGSHDHEHTSTIGKDHLSTERVINNTSDSNLRAALQLLEPLFKKHGGDLHIDNWMMRGDQIVIVDPLQPFLG
jgi:hypothetical protein